MLSERSGKNRLKEEKRYLQASQERESGVIRKGLMVKAVAESEGDERRGEALYIKLVVQALADEEKSAKRREYSEITRQWKEDKRLKAERTRPTETSEDLRSSDKSFFSRLVDGDFGLARTYWIYGVLVGVIANVASVAITSVDVFALFFLCYSIYEVPVLIGTWRAADRYAGSRIWPPFARIAVIFGALTLVLSLVILLGRLI